MIDRIKTLLSAGVANAARPAEAETPQLAAAALLVEAACMDGEFDGDEREAICAALGARFGAERGRGRHPDRGGGKRPP